MTQQRTSDYLQSLAAVSELEATHPIPSIAERVRELRLVCRDAAAIERRKREAGIKSAQLEVWPESTRALLRRHAELCRGED